MPERFYRNPGELLLTARHSQIDWTLFHIKGYGGHNYLKQAHAALYRRNPVLLSALREVVAETGSFSGYRRWMDLVSQWYLEKQAEETQTVESGATGKSDDQTVQKAPPPSAESTRKEPSEGERQRGANDPAGLEDESQGPGEELHQSRGSEDGVEPVKEGLSPDGENSPAPEGQETKEQAVARGESFLAIAEVIKTYAPLVQGSETLETIGSEPSAADSEVGRIPIPDLRPVTRSLPSYGKPPTSPSSGTGSGCLNLERLKGSKG